MRFPGLNSNIGPTIEQNTGTISLPSSIRSICHRYYDGCHAVAHVIDVQETERGPARAGESWVHSLLVHHALKLRCNNDCQIMNTKQIRSQDSLEILSAIEIRHDYEGWDQGRESSRRQF
ncbi:uncharacterized protein EDB91DRAFT_666358 [Suillus paluster]|uniref:uncharacterized protein n=1 Tax=Suillus paluster TaxID=48578 RepID=UPI001B878290|nr:uncharacterized protein EDB91DRAFT_666358 [Suillus paluster]KAG1732667.1 hypothetical protein EDB91DRAFT_666358 [Suillus paluster]